MEKDKDLNVIKNLIDSVADCVLKSFMYNRNL